MGTGIIVCGLNGSGKSTFGKYRLPREYEKNSVKTESKYSEKVFYDKIKNHRRP